ncbi:MAG TPA: uroporphyrinogen decarboxylase family protein [Dehalococcoidia bacterium]|nr:uroporphyrinogen decarboxylase family protein [Dehalococcoidia bacterium]
MTTTTMSHKQRLRAALDGQAVDHAPAALWGHDFKREWSAVDLAAFTIESYDTYGWDLIKLNPRATYYFEAWGSVYQPTGSTQPRLQHHPLNSAEELANLPEIEATAGVFAEQLEGLDRVVAQVGHEVDVIQTVFNPLTVASGLLGMRPPAFLELTRRRPALVHKGLATIARVLARYAAACREAGAGGVFFATVDWGTSDAADAAFYREYGRPYDLQVLAAVHEAPLNVLHVCRDHNLLDLLLDYPVAAFNWDDHGAGNASLAAAQQKTPRAVIGGIDRATLRDGTPGAIAAQARQALTETGSRRVVLAAGCSVDPSAPAANLRAVAEAARGG